MTDWNFEPPPESTLQDREVLKTGTHLVGKRIALLVTGSIAAIKAPLIARSLRRQGADVVAMVSPEALRYTTIDALEWSTINPVVTKLTAAAEHLSDEHPYEAYLVAPASYNTINKLRYGIADGVISASLASAIGRMEKGKTKVLIAPTMHGSLHNSLLIESLKHLQTMGVKIIPPKVAYGKNNLPTEAEIVAQVIRAVSNSPLKNMPILVTGGATPTPIDNVRILTNIFTGKLSGCIAEELFYRGANVKLIRGQGSYFPPSYLPHIAINTYQEYRETVLEELSQNNYQWAIFSAAVADYQPKQVFAGKIPSGGALQNIELIPTAKVIQEVKTKFSNLAMITFKYQENITHEKLIEIAQERLQQGYQMVVANRGEEKGENGAQIAYLVTANNPPQKIIDKKNIAIAICNWLEQVVT
jgi:phosphopantothenoylcysteine decarboxylase / phosphopantothenate---cysteine ligase